MESLLGDAGLPLGLIGPLVGLLHLPLHRPNLLLECELVHLQLLVGARRRLPAVLLLRFLGGN